MANGDILLDDDGNVILDDDGNVMLSDGEGDPCCCGSDCCVLLECFYNCKSGYTTEIALASGIVACSTITTPSTPGVWVRDESYSGGTWENAKDCRYLYKMAVACDHSEFFDPSEFPDPPTDFTGCTCVTPSGCGSCGPADDDFCCFSLTSTLNLTKNVTFTGSSIYSPTIAAAINSTDTSAMSMTRSGGGADYTLASGTTGTTWWAWSAPFTLPGGNKYRIILAAWFDCTTKKWLWLAELQIYLAGSGGWTYQDVVARSDNTGSTGNCCGAASMAGLAVGADGGTITSDESSIVVEGNTCCRTLDFIPNVPPAPPGGVYVWRCHDIAEGDCDTGECLDAP